MKRFFFKVYFIPFLFLVMACQPINYSSLEEENAEEWIQMASLTSSKAGQESHFGLRTPDQVSFKETFLSHKVDLVFVMDTHPSMEKFYKNPLFGSHFLSRFEEKGYDWKVAYTDMSFDAKLYSEDVEEEESVEDDDSPPSCWLQTGALAIGIFAGLPILTGASLDPLSRCVANHHDHKQKLKKRKSQRVAGEPVFTDGSFLPFEHKGKKLDVYHLSSDVDNYNSVFNDSLMWDNPKEARNSFEAPEKRETESYPLMSTIFSMGSDMDSHSDSSGIVEVSNEVSYQHSFFREDSVVVYVLVTIQDAKIAISKERVEDYMETLFLNKERVKVIPVTLNPESKNLKCQIQFPSQNSSQLIQLAEDLENKPLDICSQDLGDQLFNQISHSLYTTGYLSILQ